MDYGYGYGAPSSHNAGFDPYGMSRSSSSNQSIEDYGYGDPDASDPMMGRPALPQREASESAISLQSGGGDGSGRRRVRGVRRGSTGTYSPLDMYGSSNHTATSNSNERFESPSRAIRRGSLSREESQLALNQRLNATNNYVGDRGSLDDLKERFATTKKNLKPKPGRIQRRSSISSVTSLMSLGDQSAASNKNDNTQSNHQSIDLLDNLSPLKSGQGLGVEAGGLPGIDLVGGSDHGHQIQQQQRKRSAKTDQIIESLVWFSFHIPRAVMEDMIRHEIDLWQKGRKLGRKKKKAKTIKSEQEDVDTTNNTDTNDDGSLSSLSDEGDANDSSQNFAADFSETMMQFQGVNSSERSMVKLPLSVERNGALLFVDMSGFTKLSTLMDPESLSKVINNYFDCIVTEVLQFGGDILKFAGDAFFAEWKVVEEPDKKEKETPLSVLNASLAGSINDMDWDDDEAPQLSHCVLLASKAAISIVEKYSDYQVPVSTGEAMLNVHCGIGVGHMVGLHVGDYKEGDEEGVELRREFLILGDPIDQVARACDVATAGQVMISPEAMQALSYIVDVLVTNSQQPVCIANKKSNFYNLDTSTTAHQNTNHGNVLQPFESLRMHCNAMKHTTLTRVHVQMALYVHPVIRADELALSAAIQAGKITAPTETVESRHRAEAELRSVFTIFIKPIMSPKITGLHDVDMELFKKLGDIMHVTSRVLDRYSGHLRQFIVDDKGVVLIATFGLRGSTFPNMVSNNGLPAVFAIHRALKTEVGVENRIGATFGKVYCGVVGGVHRHEFAVMGPPVNLAARLMGSKVNNGILVDEAVKAQSDGRFQFKSLDPVKAKGYDKPVPILEPSDAVPAAKKKKSTFPFTGRKEETKVILAAGANILSDPTSADSTMVFLMGESGMGKTALGMSILDEVKKLPEGEYKTVATARSTSTETEQRIPLSSYRKIFLSIVRDVLEYEGRTGVSTEFQVSQTSFDNQSRGSSKALNQQSSNHSTRQHRRSLRLARSTSNAGIPPKRHSNADGGSLNHRDLAKKRHSHDGSDRPHLMRSKGLSLDVDDTTNDGTQTEHDTDDNDSFGKSLRGISQDILGDLSSPHSRRETRAQLPQSLSTSLHSNALHSGKHPGVAHGSGHVRDRRGSTFVPMGQTTRKGSVRGMRTMGNSIRMSNTRDDTSVQTNETHTYDGNAVPYFEKLCWVCEQLDYPYEYADIVGSQFLGLDGASSVTHVDGHIPTIDELVEFLALAFTCLVDYSDLIVLLIDDFQWVDSFSWKIFRALCNRGKKMLMMVAMRSHDKQALRRLSKAAQGHGNFKNEMLHISLVPLDLSEIKALMASVLGYPKKSFPESLCNDVFHRTGGLPAYVTQMIENIKRKKTIEVGTDGMLQWTIEGLREKKASSNSQSGAVMEETFLSRFDGLGVSVRKILQTCAVLGLSFALSDVIFVHPEMEEADIEGAIDAAVDELILIEQIEDDDDDVSVKSGSTGTSDSATQTHTADPSRSSDGPKAAKERYFQFSHAMWRKNVLTTMLKERKIELHRIIAESMEKNQVLTVEESDISRLLTLFDHWKSCRDFIKVAPLALTVGQRLEEWDLCQNSLELYEDALEMSFDSVNTTEDSDSEWVRVAAKPAIFNLILSLHVHVGLCYKRLGDDDESLSTFEDAYKIICTSSKIPSASKPLMIPILSSLCVLQMSQTVTDSKTRKKQEELLGQFVKEAMDSRTMTHVGRAMGMQAVFFARHGELDRAVDTIEKLKAVYSVEKYNGEMTEEYGRDHVIESLAESVQWHYLMEQSDQAEEEADIIVERYLPLVDMNDTDACMQVVLPLVQVFRLVGRANDSDWLFKRYIINPAHEHSTNSELWFPLFNPLAYLIELIVMEENENIDEKAVMEMETWVLLDKTDYHPDIEKKAHCLIGELGWRLAHYRDEDDDIRVRMETKCKDLLRPIARYPHGEFFLKKTAQALMEAF